MRRILSLLLSITMIFSMMAASVVAVGEQTGPSVSVTSAAGAPGDVVTVTMSISGFGAISAMAVDIIPEDGLQLQAGEWIVEGLVAAVMVPQKRAAWTVMSATQVEGDVLSLSFKVPQLQAGQTDFSYDFALNFRTSTKADATVYTTQGTITVVNPATGLTLTPEVLELDISGVKTADLTATVTPADSTDSVSWSSSDPAVAKVENGKVTGLKAGTATITATAGAFSRTCVVTVKCSHDLKKTAAVAPSCEAGGNNEYYTCQTANCGLVFKADKVTLTTVAAETLGKLGHAPTFHEAVASTCDTPGNVAYWTCGNEGCVGKYYADENCTVVLATVVTDVDPDNHVTTEVRGAAAANCYQNGYTGDTHCAACDAMIQAGSVIGATGNHIAGTELLKDATSHWNVCTTAGCGEKVNVEAHGQTTVIDREPTEDLEGEKHELCQKCGHTWGFDSIPKKDHEHIGIEHHAAQASTCSVNGTVEYWTCASSKCTGKFYADDKCLVPLETNVAELDPNNHVHTQVKDAAAANCYQDGYTGDTWCDDCEEMIQAGTVIGATGNHQAVAAWATNDGFHWHTCQTAGCPAELNKAAHDFKEVYDRYPTEDLEGEKHEECACGLKRNEGTVVDKLDHVHVGIQHHAAVAATCKTTGSVEYWTCSSTKCAGKFYGDANCQTLLDTVTTPIDPANHVDTEVRDAVAATCYQIGYSGDTWCKDCETVIRLGHLLSATEDHVSSGVWSHDDEFHWMACTTAGCPAELNKVEHGFEVVIDREPTEDLEGEKHEACICGAKRNEGTVMDKLDHVHVGIQHHAAVASTCKVEGKVAYWTCASAKCAGKFYSDDKCLIQLETITVPVDPANHVNTEVRDAAAANCHLAGYTGDTWCVDCQKMIQTGTLIQPTGAHVAGDAWYFDNEAHWMLCVTEGCAARLEVSEHTFNWVIDVDPTEDAQGVKHEYCECGAVRNEGTVIEKLPHVHVGITSHDAVAGTCVAEGTVKYWTCASAKCAGKFYTDEKCQTVLETIVAPKDPANHVATEVKNAVAADCDSEGYTGDTFCTGCHALIETGKAVSATGKHTAKAGYVCDDNAHWQVCADCGMTIESTRKAHSYKWVTDKKATESATGTKHEECSVCKDTRSENTGIPKLKHAPALVGAKDPTCTEKGRIAHYYCATCGNYYAVENGKVGGRISYNDTVVAATGHNMEGDWITDDENHWHACKCGEIGDKAAHTLELTGVVEATAEKEGYTGDNVCSVCGFVAQTGETVPALPTATEAPTEGENEVATEAPAVDGAEPQGESRNVIVWIAVVVAAAGVVAAPVVIKRKKTDA